MAQWDAVAFAAVLFSVAQRQSDSPLRDLVRIGRCFPKSGVPIASSIVFGLMRGRRSAQFECSAIV